MANTDTDTGELAHAVGAELQAHREKHGWSRPAVAACSDGNVSTKGLQSAEKATRSVSIRQMELIGHLCAIRPSELLLRAEHRISWEPAGVAVDLDILAECRHEALRPAAHWARRNATPDPSQCGCWLPSRSRPWHDAADSTPPN
jgi:hypothetical protein